MIEGIKTNQPKVKASKSDKLLQSYGHLKFCMDFISVYTWRSRLLDVAQRLLVKFLTFLGMLSELTPDANVDCEKAPFIHYIV